MDFTLYWFMFPVAILVATAAMLSGIGGAALFTPGSMTTATGHGGPGGVINVNSSGVVDIQGQYDENGYLAAIIDASGQVIGTYDTTVINIEGSLVNNEVG